MIIMTAGDVPDALDRIPSLRKTVSAVPVRVSGGTRADDRVARYAPLLMFSAREAYFPIDPAAFIARARLRRYGWSEEFRDAAWHAGRAGWESCAGGVPMPAGGENPDIAEVCRRMQVEARSPVPDSRNRRPCDPRNLWYGRRAGYALELTEPHDGALRGERGHAPCLYYDRYSVPTHAGVYDVISYWFFYAISTQGAAHEGDWQCVSVVIPEGKGDLPHVQFGSSRRGVTCGFSEVEVAEFTHPIVYVDRGTHRMCRVAADLDEYPATDNTVALRTWSLEARRVLTMPWATFDGAWGRVGPGPRSTGSLGPLFQREDVGSVGADNKLF
jgi:hypothetical protein